MPGTNPASPAYAWRRLIRRRDQRFAAIDQRFIAIEGRFDAFDTKLPRQFPFLVGIQVTVLAGMLTAFFALR